MKRHLLRWAAIAGIGIAVIAAFSYWNARPRDWLVEERPGTAGRTDVLLSVDAREAGRTGGRLTLTCRDGKIGAELSPVYVQCIGNCDGPGVLMSLTQTFETFVYPEQTSHTGWVAPWVTDRKTATAIRTFEDDPPATDDPTSYPVGSEAFIARLLAARELSISIGSGHMSFDSRRLADVLPKLRTHCPARTAADSTRPGSNR